MKVRDIMMKPTITVFPKTTYGEMAKIFYEQNLSWAPVVNESGELVGIISGKDLFRALYPLYQEYVLEPHAYYNQEVQEDELDVIKKQPIGHYMSREVSAIDADAPILHAGGLMLAHGVHQLPVIHDGKLVGFVSREDVYGAILKRHLGL